MATPTPPQLVDAHAAARARLSEAAVRYAGDQAGRFTGWYDSAAITAFAERVAARVQASQRQTAAVTDSYLLRLLRLLVPSLRLRSPGPVDVTRLRLEVPSPASPYGRVADTYRFRIAEGDEPAVALEKAVERARVAADTDVTLAFRAQVVQTLSAVPDDVEVRFRRVIHPELAASHHSCALCVVIADRVYNRGDLLPVHARCACTVTPIIGEVGGKGDPGSPINAADLAALYRAAGSTGAADLKRVKVAVHAHGELGPVLRVAGDDFRGPGDVAASAA